MADYLREVMDTELRAKIVERTIAALQAVTFTTIAVRGVSGISIGSIVAHQMTKELCIVRKPFEACHSDTNVEGARCTEYIVLDDFIATGRTVDAIIAAMTETFSAKCIGVYMYQWASVLETPYHLANIKVRCLNPVYEQAA